MKIITESIKIKVAHGAPKDFDNDPSSREAFWYPLRNTEEYKSKSLQSLEGNLTRNFGEQLRENLKKDIEIECHEIEEAVYGRELTKFKKKFAYYFEGSSFQSIELKERYSPLFEPFSRLIEFRQQMIKDIPSLKQAVERIALISGITFIARIESYGSLNLSLIPSSLKKLSQIFDNEFESFQVFLEAYVPTSFGEVFTRDFADSMTFDIVVPSSIKQAFDNSYNNNEMSKPTVQESQQIPPHAQVKSESVQKAEWLWKLANGSLLIPLLLALAVLYFGFKELSSYRNAQYEAVKPILEHQLKLLQEDRERMFGSTNFAKKEENIKTKKPNKANSTDVKGRASD